LFLTEQQAPGANFGLKNVEVGKLVDSDPDQKFFAVSISTLSKTNLTKNAYVGIMGCHTGACIAPELAKQLERPVQATPSSVNFTEEGTAFVRLYRQILFGGFQFYGGVPSSDGASRDEKWSEDDARKAGY
jgi:hypothetical protein